jgi:hypothetical protein
MAWCLVKSTGTTLPLPYHMSCDSLLKVTMRLNLRNMSQSARKPTRDHAPVKPPGN